MKFLRKLTPLFFFFVTLFTLTTSFASSTETLSPELQKYLRQIEKKYKFDHPYLVNLFKQVKFNPEIIKKMEHPYEAKPWPHYRTLFLTDKRITNGLTFWETHQKILNEAQAKYGVPANLITAILGVETSYGEHRGSYPVLSTLTTLSFHYPKRADFFKKELTQYLLMTREQHLDPLTLTGSYAGAIGIPQFMPSTYRAYAIDYSQQGSADLVHNTEDAIFSVANYLKKMGWKKNQPVAFSLQTKSNINKKLLSKSAIPSHSLTSLEKKGVQLPPESKKFSKNKGAVIALEQHDQISSNYWLTFGNFRAIMRYNPRINYAMAVYQLGEAINDANRVRIGTIKAGTASASKRST